MGRGFKKQMNHSKKTSQFKDDLEGEKERL